MAKAKTIYTGGVNELRQVAIREDGVVFARLQKHTSEGYKWTKWLVIDTLFEVGKNQVKMGLATLFKATKDSAFVADTELFDETGEIRVRLPN